MYAPRWHRPHLPQAVPPSKLKTRRPWPLTMALVLLRPREPSGQRSKPLPVPEGLFADDRPGMAKGYCTDKDGLGVQALSPRAERPHPATGQLGSRKILTVSVWRRLLISEADTRTPPVTLRLRMGVLGSRSPMRLGDRTRPAAPGLALLLLLGEVAGDVYQPVDGRGRLNWVATTIIFSRRCRESWCPPSPGQPPMSNPRPSQNSPPFANVPMKSDESSPKASRFGVCSGYVVKPR